LETAAADEQIAECPHCSISLLIPQGPGPKILLLRFDIISNGSQLHTSYLQTWLPSWSATSIVAPVPTGATTGNVAVTVSGAASNGGELHRDSSTPNITSFESDFRFSGYFRDD